MKIKLCVCALLMVVCIPSVLEARHNSFRDGVDRSDLDDDLVKEIYLPILFGLTRSGITSDFGDPRGGGTRSHEGQDMFAPKGTPIVSPTEAIVISTGKGDSAGNYVYTANPGGETFRYMHLDEIANLDRGDEIKMGQYLGTVGDTGNATGLAYHLHFEMRDEKNRATDPFLRITKEYTLKQKMSFLPTLFKNIRNDDEYAEFLVTEFPQEFKEALNSGLVLPDPIEKALKNQGVVSTKDTLAQLRLLIASLPKALTKEMQEGSQGTEVVLLQLYLMYASEGTARDALAGAGPTGYFGPVTTQAVVEYQTNNRLDKTGRYDVKTRLAMIANKDFKLQLGNN